MPNVHMRAFLMYSQALVEPVDLPNTEIEIYEEEWGSVYCPI